jgi:hypothetical protein
MRTEPDRWLNEETTIESGCLELLHQCEAEVNLKTSL